MAPHQERVVKERAELFDKLQRLAVFNSSGGEVFAALPGDEKICLLRQQAYMAMYLQVLDERIAAFR